MLRDNKDEAFELLRTALTSPHFDSTDVERIRSQVLSGLRRETTNPSALAGRKFLELALETDREPNHLDLAAVLCGLDQGLCHARTPVIAIR